MKVSALWSYPVKGCHRLDHDAAAVEPCGLAGDRRWMVVDADGVGLTQRRTARLVALRARPRPGGLTLAADGRADLTVSAPHGGEELKVRVFAHHGPVTARRAGPAADAWLTGLLGEPARLVWLADPAARRTDGGVVSFADTYPVLVATTASLDALNDWLVAAGEEPVPMTRFRPNVVVSGSRPWAEDEWLGRRLRVGAVTLRVATPCDRCLVTTIDQETGETTGQPLRMLGERRRRPGGLMFAVNAVPGSAGVIRVGDPVSID